jgi:3-dehydroquinate synthase
MAGEVLLLCCKKTTCRKWGGVARMTEKTAAGVERLEVGLGRRSYPILIGPGVLGQVGPSLGEVHGEGRIFLVSAPPIFDLFGFRVEQSLKEAGREYTVELIPDGEASKTLQTAEHLYDRALGYGLDRTSCFLALGGGVVGDVTGFVAATFMRGVSFAQIPTTLLSQVDSSVGGKVAVNHPRGKNMIGAFHQPRAVFIDTGTLETLPRRDYLAGIAEIIRYGAALDSDFFSYLENNMQALLDKDPLVLQHCIRTSCAIKARVVAADERETTGLRSHLNFGHTFAHAIETVTGYARYRHGEAVAIGMVMAARLAERLGLTSSADTERQVALIASAGLPVAAEGADPEKVVAAMAQDKKAEGGNVRFVLTEKIGSVNIYDGIAHEILVEIVSRR